MRIAALLVAAGSGSRFGAAQPKQFAMLAGKPVVRWAAEALLADTDLVQVVGDPALAAAALNGLAMPEGISGGATRQDSVRLGLEALAGHDPDVVLVHDGARPFIPPGTVRALLAALDTVHDTVLDTVLDTVPTTHRTSRV